MGPCKLASLLNLQRQRAASLPSATRYAPRPIAWRGGYTGELRFRDGAFPHRSSTGAEPAATAYLGVTRVPTNHFSTILVEKR